MKILKKIKQLFLNVFENKGGQQFNYQTIEERKAEMLQKHYIHNPMTI